MRIGLDQTQAYGASSSAFSVKTGSVARGNAASGVMSGSAAPVDKVLISAASTAQSAAESFGRGAMRLDYGADEKSDVNIGAIWGQAERLDGATVTVGEGSVQQDGTVFTGTIVMVENEDGSSSVTVLRDDNPHRLVRDEMGGYVLAEDMQGGDGDDLFVGKDLSNLDLEGGSGENMLFAARANNLTYLGGRGNDMLYGSFTASKFDMGTGDDVIDGALSGSEVDLGQGDDTIMGDVFKSSVMGGDGDDLIDATVREAVLDMGKGDDHVKGYALLNSVINMGAGDDWLDFYELEDSVATMDDPDAEGTDPGGNDRITGYEIERSEVTMGAGRDSVDIYELEYSTLDTGSGNDRIQAYSLESSDVVTGAGDDTIDTYEILGTSLDTDERLSDEAGEDGKTGEHDETDATNRAASAQGGNDKVLTQVIEGSAIRMGGGDDVLKAYRLADSQVDMGDIVNADDADDEEEAEGLGASERSDETSPDGNATGAAASEPAEAGHGGDSDRVYIYEAVDSIVTLGGGDDSLNVYTAKLLALGAGEGEDSLNVSDENSRIIASDALENVVHTPYSKYRGKAPGQDALDSSYGGYDWNYNGNRKWWSGGEGFTAWV